MTRTKFALLLGTALIAGLGVAFAQMEDSRASLGMGQERMGSRFFAEYDLNHDGRITRDEMNKALAQRFASTAKGGAMTLDQFESGRLANFRQAVGRAFRRADWNGDGKMSLDEYMASERSYFESLDRQGAGTIACGGSGRSGRRGSRTQFCADNDLNRDGQVARAEFDKAAAQRFAAAAKGSKMLGGEQFFQIALGRFKASNARYFQRLDANHDGKLSLAEYSAAPLRTFARADRNSDGAITQDEIGRRSNWRHAQAGRKPGQPG